MAGPLSRARIAHIVWPVKLVSIAPVLADGPCLTTFLYFPFPASSDPISSLAKGHRRGRRVEPERASRRTSLPSGLSTGQNKPEDSAHLVHAEDGAPWVSDFFLTLTRAREHLCESADPPPQPMFDFTTDVSEMFTNACGSGEVNRTSSRGRGRASGGEVLAGLSRAAS